jgi:tetratricopeptide (TPR) repeat protein
MILGRCSFFLVLLILIFPLHSVYGQRNPDLQRGIAEFQQENYEEALDSLHKARNADPRNSQPAYYLGITYKNMERYREAQKQLEAVLDLTPRIKEAILELAEVDYNLGEYDKALKVINMAEDENFRPGQTAFIKGLILLGMNNIPAAVESFEKAGQTNAALVAAADYQIGQAYLKNDKLDEAESHFKNVIEQEPGTDMAIFSSDFLVQIEEKRREKREFRYYLGLHYQYDDNVVLRPTNDSAAVAISDEEDSRAVLTFGMEYVPKPRKPLDFTAHYSVYMSFHDDLSEYDYHRHTAVLNPSYLINEKSRADLVLRGSYSWVDNEEYLGTAAVSPMYTRYFSPEHTIQTYVSYQKKDYSWDIPDTDEDRDANEYSFNVNWFHFFAQDMGVFLPFMEDYDLSFFAKNRGYFNLFYKLSKEDTDGDNWEYVGNRAAATLLLPLIKNWKVRLTGDFTYQNYDNRHTIFNKERRDYIYDAFALLYYRFHKYLDLQLLYNYVRNDSNIALYDYERNVYSIGIEWRY